MWHGVCFGASRPCIQYWGASSVQQLSEASQMIGRYLLPPPDEERCDTLWRGGETNARVTSQFIFPAVFTLETYAACYMLPPPRTFIRPPKMATFHTIEVLLTGCKNISSTFYALFFKLSCISEKFERGFSFQCPWFNFQVVLGQRKQSFWQVFLTRCRQIWCMLSQIQPLLEGKLSSHTASVFQGFEHPPSPLEFFLR